MLMRTLFLLLVSLFSFVVAEDVTCSFRQEIEIIPERRLTVYQETSQENNTVSIEVVYAGLAWIGFGFSEKGLMVGSTGKSSISISRCQLLRDLIEILPVVIGQPGGVITDVPNAGKFELGGYSIPAVQPLPPSEQTLIDASIENNETHTFLKFTKLLDEDGELNISATKENIAIFGVGRNIELLSIHDYNGAFPITLSACSNTTTRAKLFNDGPVRRDLWVIHGYMMAAAWGFLLPLGIGSSLLRDFIPGEHTWLAFHWIFNGLVSDIE